MSNCDGRGAELAFPESQNRKNTETGLETFMTKEKDDAFVCLFKCWMDECWVKRPETVVTNETDDTVVQLFSSVSFQIAFIITLFAGWMKTG